MPTSIYRLKSGQRVPGVTTILGHRKEAEALYAWNYNKGYEDAEAGRPPNRFAVVQEGANIGTYTHALVQWHLDGEMDLEPDPAQIISVPYLSIESIERGRRGYFEFLSWKDQTKLFIISHERPLISERLKVGGTPDGLSERRNKIGLMDWKTSRRLYADYLLQLAGYWLLHEENYPDQPIEDGVHIVRFSKDYGDFSHYHFDQLDVEKRQFIRLREVYADDQLIKARI